MITITHDGAVLTPELVLDGYEWERPSGNLVHALLGTDEVDVTFSPAGLRRGTFRAFFLEQFDALECEIHHSQAGTFRLADTDVSAAGMTYVPVDSVGVRLDPPTGRWIVTVPYHEVPAL